MSRMCAVAAILLLAAACSSGGEEAAEEPTATDATEAAAGGAYESGIPLEVENCGRTLTFEAPPQAVVTGYHTSFELLAELGDGDTLIGRSPFDELGEDGAGVLPEHRDLYDAVPLISEETTSLPAAEAMLALGADFVLSEGYYNFDAENGNATIEELETSGANVYITGGWCSAEEQLDFSAETLVQDVRTLGMIFGVPEEGEALASELEGILEEVAEATADVDPATVVLLDASPDALFAMGQGMGAQLAELAGLDNPFAEGDTYGEYSVEEVAASDADGFAVISYLPATVEDRIAVIEEIAPNTPAVQDGRYVEIPAIATHPGYRTLLAVRDLAEGFYPDAFGG